MQKQKYGSENIFINIYLLSKITDHADYLSHRYKLEMYVNPYFFQNVNSFSNVVHL